MEIKFDSKKISIVNIDEVRPNTWNPKDENTEEYRRVKLSIQTKGFRLPIIVRENQGYEIIDGEQRWRAAKELGFKKVPIYNEGKMSTQEAKELTIWYQQQVPFNEIDLAHLVKELVQNKDFKVPYSEEEIEDLVQLTNFDWDEFETDELIGKEKIDFRTLSINMTKEQYEIVQEALEKVKKKAEDMDISDARALELICADFLAGK